MVSFYKRTLKNESWVTIHFWCVDFSRNVGRHVRTGLNTTSKRYCRPTSCRYRRLIETTSRRHWDVVGITSIWCCFDIEATSERGRRNISDNIDVVSTSRQHRNAVDTRLIMHCLDIETTSNRDRHNVCCVPQRWYYVVSTGFQHCIDIVSTSKQCCTISSYQYWYDVDVQHREYVKNC